MTPFALTWMVDMIADVLTGRTAQGIASTMEKLSTMVRFGCWKMTGVPKGKLTVGHCLAQRWSVNSVSSPRTSAARAVSPTLARLTPSAMTSPKLAWTR
ncbi:hypothetical protein Celaphus_00011575 [Cervus elaphus hippelaphus]|uniref:Uncharacterized protein n=1 Tax=Cervus elaphus hippelaphus TaxID=46360 RepID=A0A212DFK3_CEREH|nr:hypothetical protein Celaphus_00011575 [Cervus elaphus hippelaphus]